MREGAKGGEEGREIANKNDQLRKELIGELSAKYSAEHGEKSAIMHKVYREIMRSRVFDRLIFELDKTEPIQHKEKIADFKETVEAIAEIQARLHEKIDYDDLTRLYRRDAFALHYEQTVGEIGDNKEGAAALAFFDLDHFKRINDICGHDVGDQALKMMAEKIGTTIRPTDAAGRMGGDEFVLLLNDIKDPSFIKNTFERIYKSINSLAIVESGEGGSPQFQLVEIPIGKEGIYFEKYPEQRLHRRLSISMGVRTFQPGEQVFPTLESALKQIDIAGTYTKENGRGGICFIDQIDVEGKMSGRFHKFSDGTFVVSEEVEIKRDHQRENSKEHLTEKIIGALERIMSCVYKKHNKRPPSIDGAVENLATEISNICKN